MRVNINPPTAAEISRVMSALGRKGGSARSERKSAACRANGMRPCAKGKNRGRPKGKTHAKVIKINENKS
jgi:hypothetical protein